MNYWFYIDPFVHIAIKNESVLLFNTLNGKCLKVLNNQEIAAKMKELTSYSNSYVIKISEKERDSSIFKEFFNGIRNHFMGGLLNEDWYSGKPVQIIPEMKIMESFFSPNSLSRNRTGTDILKKLIEISFYLNSDPSQKDRYEYYRQFLYPASIIDSIAELDLNNIKDLLTEAKNSNLLRLNILGADIFRYSHINELIQLINDIKIEKNLYLKYSLLPDYNEEFFKRINDTMNRIGEKKEFYKFNLFFTRDDLFSSKNIFSFFYNLGITTKFCFIIKDEEDFIKVEKFIEKNEVSEYEFFPYFNGENIEFFKHNIFLDENEVLGSKPSLSEILKRKRINEIKFGKLIVLSNGAVYADLNKIKLGTLGSESLKNLIYKEITDGNSWRETRSKLEPCKDCLYELICPSPSFYENALNRNNICHIITSDKEG
ncbi:MAG: TIGR04150 pseudo-rSAM protein [Prolixibacteraceae bacterium]|nr:TIGR04150 pseudo-rSAM protein [Prolixibacteraceae bacterium]